MNQLEADFIEIIDSFNIGGERLCYLVFNAVCDARKLNRWESIALSDKVLKHLKTTVRREL